MSRFFSAMSRFEAPLAAASAPRRRRPPRRPDQAPTSSYPSPSPAICLTNAGGASRSSIATPEAVRLDRLNDGAAILYNHRLERPSRSTTSRSSVVADGHVVRGNAIVSWACRRGTHHRPDHRQPPHKSVSVGYEMHAVVEQTTSKDRQTQFRKKSRRPALFGRVLERVVSARPPAIWPFSGVRLTSAAGPLDRAADAPATYRVIDWEPLENSLVTVPGRCQRRRRAHGRPTNTAPPQTPAPASPATLIPQGAQNACDNPSTEHLAALKAAATATMPWQRIKLQSRPWPSSSTALALGDMPAQAIRNGVSAEDFTKQLMAHVAQRGTGMDPGNRPERAPKSSRYSIVRAISRHAQPTTGPVPAWSAKPATLSPPRPSQAGLQRQAENSFFLPMEVQRRDMTVGTASAGGNMVATTLRPQDFIELLRNNDAAEIAWAPARSPASSVTWTSPSRPAPRPATGLSTEATSDHRKPANHRPAPAAAEGARRLYRNLAPAAAAEHAGCRHVRDGRTWRKVLGVALDAAGINVGGSGAPVGILGTGSIGAFTGTTLGLAALLDAQVDVAGANALHPGVRVPDYPDRRQPARPAPALCVSTDTPLWKGNILEGERARLQGCVSTNQMPGRDRHLRRLPAGDLMRSGARSNSPPTPTPTLPAGITGIRAFLTADVGVRIAGAFSASSSIT
jgi:hypothetical protein